MGPAPSMNGKDWGRSSVLVGRFMCLNWGRETHPEDGTLLVNDGEEIIEEFGANVISYDPTYP